MKHSIKSQIFRASLFIVIGAVSVGCSQLMGGLRPDLDDSQSQAAGPVQGGQWPERGFLADDLPENPGADRAVGHSERGIASEGSGAPTDSQWYTQNDATELRRDSLRGDGSGEPAFSNSPNMTPPTKRLYRNGDRATRADFVDDSQNEGSLWASDGQTNYYFTKNKVRGVGDIVSIKMDGGMIKDIGTEVKRTLTSGEKDAELAMAQARLNAKAAGAAATPDATTAANGATSPAAGAPAAPAPTDNRSPASVGDGPKATPADVDLTKSLEVKEGDVMMAEIMERYPNGNYKIRGSKRVMYKNGYPRLVTIVAVAKGSDIGEDDTINAGKLYEYQLEAFR